MSERRPPTMPCPRCWARAAFSGALHERLTCEGCGLSLRLDEPAPQLVGEGRAGGLAAANAAAFARLDAERDELTESIARCGAVVRLIARAHKALGEVRTGERGRPANREPCAVTSGLYEVLALAMWNEARTRASDPDSVVWPRVQRTAAFGSLRHALAVWAESDPSIGLGPSALVSTGSGGGDGGEPRVKGQDAVHRRVDVGAAVRAAELSPAQAAMVDLVEHGVMRSRARRTKRGLDLAVEPLRVEEAARVEKLDVRDARAALRTGKARLRCALRERGLIPAERARRGSYAPRMATGGAG